MSKELTFLDAQGKLFKYAQTLAASDLIPDTYKGKPANCLMAVEISRNLGVPFLSVVNGLDIIMGKPAYKSSFLASLINISKLFKTPLMIDYKGEGNDLIAIAKAQRQDDSWCSMEVGFQMAIEEGWVKRNPKYRTMPKLMLGYRAISFFARMYCPEVTLGLHSVEEISDIGIQQEKAPIVIPNTALSSEEI